MAKKIKDTHNGVNLITLIDQSSTITEQYRTIRTNIQFAMVDQKLKSIVITSSGPSEGKSTTSANLAVVFATSGLKVLLVDADLRKPTVHKTFGLTNGRGLSSLLSNRGLDINEVCQTTVTENLKVLTSGPKPPNPAELLGSQRMTDLIAAVENQFDLVIFDMPPVVAVTDAQVMAVKTDGTILAVRQKVTNKSALANAKKLLDIVNANVLGVVFNGVERGTNGAYYEYEYK
ncbi:CpsD/CapB family tyrosine-protein kinase [Enterococcus timonensis]|uniref:CpsD/CapB family tyrosine-protein kinase n=1 Tax=Enterococcus timonensis TaxID=1852364 RepID=UPI0008DB215F|nr:CpsD/CapB family tyrosine-protein kinase [Enterococcus timonensis]